MINFSLLELIFLVIIGLDLSTAEELVGNSCGPSAGRDPTAATAHFALVTFPLH